MLCPRSNLLTEHVELATVRMDARDGKQVDARVICFRGRVFVRSSLFEMIRRTVAPNLRDRVADNLAIKAPLSSSSDGSSVAPAPVSLSAALVSSKLPETSVVGPRFGGGGFRGGVGVGGGFRGGPGYLGVRGGVGFRGPAYGYRGRPWGYGGYGVGLGTGLFAGSLLFGPRYYGYPYAPGCWDPITGAWIC